MLSQGASPPKREQRRTQFELTCAEFELSSIWTRSEHLNVSFKSSAGPPPPPPALSPSPSGLPPTPGQAARPSRRSRRAPPRAPDTIGGRPGRRAVPPGIDLEVSPARPPPSPSARALDVSTARYARYRDVPDEPPVAPSGPGVRARRPRHRRRKCAPSARPPSSPRARALDVSTARSARH